MKNALLLVPVLTAVAAAQSTFTSPPDFETREGASVTTTTHVAYYAASRTQYLDGMQRGTTRPNINRLRLRRDAAAATTTLSAARTVNLGVVLAHCDLVANPTPSTTFATNYKGAPTLVYTVKPTNLPNHGPQSLVMPAPWTVAIPFDVTFSYNGTDDLLYETTGNTNSLPASSYSLDAITGNSTVGGGLGDFRYNGWTACVVPPNTAQFDILSAASTTTSGNSVTISWNALRGPINSPAVLAVGLSDPNISGILCAPLRTSAQVIVPAGTTTSAGAVNPVSVTFPAPPTPARLYAQFAAVDVPNAALYLSDATEHLIVPYTAATVLNLWRIQNTTSDVAATGTSSRTLIPVAQFTY